MPKDDVTGLVSLGSGNTTYKYDEPTIELLEVFPNQYPERDYQITLECFEITTLCPKTKQPDFATFFIDYRPDKLCLETKSVKTLFLFLQELWGFHGNHDQ